MGLRKYDRYSIEVESNGELTDLELELYCYRQGHPIEKGGLGRAGHFKRISEMLFGPKSHFPFIWNPWAEKMNDVIHRHPITGQECPHVAFSGCKNSNKSHFAGLYALINWLCAPSSTYVFITSTSITDSKHRVWKSVNKLFTAVPGLPGVLVDSQAKIVTRKVDGKHDDTAGIFIIAGSPSRAREGIGKIIGRKNARVIFLADELPELSPAILDGAFSNLNGNPFFQFVAMGNFKSREDSFGEFIEPKDGWDSITPDSEEWECAKYGAYCVRFDGLKSPNIAAGKDIFPHLYGLKQLKEDRQAYGEFTAPFMRMVRSFETPIGYENTVYSESDFTSGHSYEQPVWLEGYTNVGASDPSYTNGGDRFVLRFGRWGQIILPDGMTVWALAFTKKFLLKEDVRKAAERPRSFQMADQIKALCEAEGVKPEHYAQDTTAAGSALADVVAEVWSNRIYRVNFSGSPTERVASADGKLASELYVNRVTEIWYIGREFAKYGQLRGLDKETTREMKARNYITYKSAEGLKMEVETKPKMKARLQLSPDLADAALIMVDLVREMFGAVPGSDTAFSNANTWQKQWKSKSREISDLYDPVEV